MTKRKVRMTHAAKRRARRRHGAGPKRAIRKHW